MTQNHKARHSLSASTPRSAPGSVLARCGIAPKPANVVLVVQDDAQRIRSAFRMVMANRQQFASVTAPLRQLMDLAFEMGYQSLYEEIWLVHDLEWRAIETATRTTSRAV